MSTTLQEEVRPGFALVDPVEVPVVVEEEIVFCLPNKVEEVEETEVKGQFSQGRMRRTAMRLLQERMAKYILALLASNAIFRTLS